MAQPFFPSLPPSPPYGVTIPRTLQRWNDINAQNGPLTRVRGFIQIPVFMCNHVNPVTGGARKMAQFTFNTIPSLRGVAQAFSFVDWTKQLASLTAQGLTITVAYGVNEGEDIDVIRYVLASYNFLTFQAAGAITTYGLYTNQFIPANFCIEVWDLGVCAGPFNSFNPIMLYTSILGTSDYRYAVDFNVANLVCNFTLDTQFNNTSIHDGNGFALPITFAPCAVVPIGITNLIAQQFILADELAEPITDENNTFIGVTQP